VVRVALENQVETFAKFSVISADGRSRQEVRYPKTMGPNVVAGIRSMEAAAWSGSNHLLLFGEINGNNCLFLRVEIKTSDVVSNGVVDCALFAPSPDNKLFAAVFGHGVFSGPEDELRDMLSIGNAVYPPDPPNSTIRLLSKPVWSSDISAIAFMEHDYATGTDNVVVVKTTGVFTRVPLSPNISRPVTLSWVADNLLLDTGLVRYLVDQDAKAIKSGGKLIDDLIAKESVGLVRQRGLAKAQQLGATDADVFIPKASK